jgi:hypothetical protein
LRDWCRYLPQPTVNTVDVEDRQIGADPNGEINAERAGLGGDDFVAAGLEGEGGEITVLLIIFDEENGAFGIYVS